MTGRARILSVADDRCLPDREQALLDRARALIPRVAERAAAATAARMLPAETIAEYRDAGILRILQPKRFGGMQGRFSLFSRIVEELTYGCASSAWVYAVLAEHQWIIAQYPEQAQIDVWGDDPEAVAASSLAPREAARPVPGGWRLSGHYPFSSGCDYAQWAIIGAFLGPKGDPRGIAYLLVPLAEIEIVDDWQVLGLLGTGSKSLVLRDIFVPEHRSVMVSDLFAGTPPRSCRWRSARPPPQSMSRPCCCTPGAITAPPKSPLAAGSPRPRHCVRAAIWSTPSTRSAGRSTGCASWTVRAGSMTATRWAPSAAT